MYHISPTLVIAISAVIGAVALAYTFLQTKRSTPLMGAVLGLFSGGVGALLFMLPLDFCTFETERTTLDLVLGIVLIVIGITGSTVVVNWIAQRLLRGEKVMATDTQPGAFKGGLLTAGIFLFPTIFILGVFLYYPMFETFRLSTLLARLGAPRTAFICLDNFTRLVDNQRYIDSLIVSFAISAGIIIFALSLSLLIATMAQMPIKGARIYRTLLIWPYALSPVIAGIIFQLLFNPIAGVINHILDSLFGFTVPWLLDPNVAPWTIVLASVWNIMGFNILFYIAGLQNIPRDMLEAAAIDGANAFQRFFRITVPLLSPITFFLIVTNTTYAFFETFGLIDFLTGGGPTRSTSTLMYEVYVLGIENRDLGKAAAQSLILFLIVIGITVLQFRTSRNRVNYGA